MKDDNLMRKNLKFFCEIIKFCDVKGGLLEFREVCFAHIFAKSTYFTKQIIKSLSSNYNLPNDKELAKTLRVCNFFNLKKWSINCPFRENRTANHETKIFSKNSN